jgi:biopolymer transport protein ExbB
MNLNVLLQISEVTVTGEEVAEMNLLDMAFKGGWIMIPLLILCILAVYIFIERMVIVKKASQKDTTFMNKIKDYINEGKIEAALTLCKRTNTPYSRMIEKGITRLGRPMNDVMVAIENVGNLEIMKLEKGLPLLATVAGGAPMIGFLGTVVGMVQSFYAMEQAGSNVDVMILASGIYTAMVTTVAGLIVGILAYFDYNYLTGRVDKVVSNMEAHSLEFMDILNGPAD